MMSCLSVTGTFVPDYELIIYLSILFVKSFFKFICELFINKQVFYHFCLFCAKKLDVLRACARFPPKFVFLRYSDIFFKKGLTNPPFHIIIYANRKIYNQGR